MSEKFQTMEEIKEYLNHEKITCLLCGLKFRGLFRHIEKTHKMHPNDYKIKFGIPPSIGLTGTETKKLNSENGKIIYEIHSEVINEALKRGCTTSRKHKLGFSLKEYPALQKKQTAICMEMARLPNHISKTEGYITTNCAECGVVIQKRATVKNRKKLFCKQCLTKHQNKSCYNTPSYLDRERMREYWRAWHHLNKNNNSLFMDNYFKKYRQCDQVVKEAGNG